MYSVDLQMFCCDTPCMPEKGVQFFQKETDALAYARQIEATIKATPHCHQPLQIIEETSQSGTEMTINVFMRPEPNLDENMSRITLHGSETFNSLHYFLHANTNLDASQLEQTFHSLCRLAVMRRIPEEPVEFMLQEDDSRYSIWADNINPDYLERFEEEYGAHSPYELIRFEDAQVALLLQKST